MRKIRCNEAVYYEDLTTNEKKDFWEFFASVEDELNQNATSENISKVLYGVDGKIETYEFV